MSDCEPLGPLRMAIFGKENLVEPGEIPDFSALKPYQLVAFFREAKFDTLTMHPFLAQYLPTEKSRNEDDQDMRKAKDEGFKEGNKWTSKYLYHIPLIRGFSRQKKKKDGKEDGEEETSNLENQEENDANQSILNNLDPNLDLRDHRCN